MISAMLGTRFVALSRHDGLFLIQLSSSMKPWLRNSPQILFLFILNTSIVNLRIEARKINHPYLKKGLSYGHKITKISLDDLKFQAKLNQNHQNLKMYAKMQCLPLSYAEIHL